MKEYVVRVLLMGGGSVSARMSEAVSAETVAKWKAIFSVPADQGRQTPCGVFSDDAAIDGRFVVAVERYVYEPSPDYAGLQREAIDLIRKQADEGEDWRHT